MLKKTVFAVAFSLCLLSSAALAQSVSISSPIAGATVGSPVHVVATADGGSSRASAMRIYVDSQNLYTVQQASLDTFVTLSTGKHTLKVVGWNTAGLAFSSSMSITVGTTSTTSTPPTTTTSTSTPPPTTTTSTSTPPTTTTSTSSTSGSTTVNGVTITSPGSGATVTSPVNFVASAVAPAGRHIVSMRIYVDSVNAFSTQSASLNTSLAMAIGSHHVTVQAWDSAGSVHKNSISVTVGAASTGGSTPPPSPAPTPTPTSGANAWGLTLPTSTTQPYSGNFSSTSSYLAATWVKPDGALYNTDFIRPYLGNLAAAGMVHDPARYSVIQNWMKWYVAHLNYGDKWGLSGTIYDYNIVNGAEVSANSADSTDSYAGTFLSLAWEYFQTGDANAQAYVKSISSQLDVIGGVIAQTQQSDGLTWAEPDYLIKYLMDNCEAYRGLRDAASLFNAIGQPTKGAYYNTLADAMLQGINGMWMNGVWAVYKGFSGTLFAPDMTVWYADSTAQLFPVLYRVVPASDPRAQQAYAAFNAAWPGWPQLSYTGQDPFPWILISGAAAQMGDTARTNAFLQNIQKLYVNTGFGGLFYDNEGGWFMRTNWYMMGGRPY